MPITGQLIALDRSAASFGQVSSFEQVSWQLWTGQLIALGRSADGSEVGLLPWTGWLTTLSRSADGSEQSDISGQVS